MNRLDPITPSLPEAWCTDPGLHVEASAGGLRVWGVASGEDTSLGLRFGEGVSVELSLRAGLGADVAVRHLLGAVPPAFSLLAVPAAEGGLLIVAPSAQTFAASGAGEAGVAAAKPARPLADAPVS